MFSTIKRWLGQMTHRHKVECSDEKCRQQAADEKLHEQAHRLHVLEWEAYGHPKPRKRDDH